jgi:hypothetical protein
MKRFGASLWIMTAMVWGALIALLLIPSTAQGAACTLTNNASSACSSKTCALSAIAADTGHANWSGTGCTANGYVPAGGASAGAGDTITVPSGYHLTIDQNYTIGANNASNSTAAITTAGLTGPVEVGTGATLTLRGDFSATPSQYNLPTALTMDAGSSLVFDSSLSASPATTRYRFGYGSGAQYYQKFVANGIAASHIVVTSCAAGNTAYCASPSTPGLAAQFRMGTVGSAPPLNSGVTMTAIYTDFSYIGDAASKGEFNAIQESAVDSTVYQHNTCNACGPWFSTPANFNVSTETHFDYNTWTNSPQAVTVPNLGIGFDTWSSGGRSITHNVFDTCETIIYAGHVIWDNNYLGAGDCAIGVETAQTWTFNHQTQDPGLVPMDVYSGGATNGYYFLDRAQDNPHWTGYAAASTTISGFVFDEPDDVTTDSGEIFIPANGAYTQGFSNNILVPSKTGKSVAEIGSTTTFAPSNASLTMNIYHNTWVGGIGFAMLQTNENGASLVPFAVAESNLAWSNGGAYTKVNPDGSISYYGTVNTSGTAVTWASGTVFTTGTAWNGIWLNIADAYYKVSSVTDNHHLTLTGSAGTQTGAVYTQLLKNAVTTADFNSADGHVSLTLTCGGCANQGKGYVGEWTATPGTHDVSAAPYFADQLRNVALWDTKYLGNAPGTAWASGTAYSAGQVVSDSHAGYYGGATINFRCIAAHTSGASTEPNVGASWRTDWEWASLADLRTAIAAGTTYADGAIGCAGCTAIQALVKWVQRGFTPQNPALWCAGHDGETIGAVPFCANGKVLIGILAGM